MRSHLIGLSLASLFCATAFGQGGFNGEGVYVITNLRSGKAISPVRDAPSVLQFGANGALQQGWFVTPAEQGFYFIRNAASGYALSGTEGNSAPVVAVPFDGGPGQEWAIEAGKDGNAIVASRMGRVLDIPGGAYEDGAPLHTYDRDGDSNQRFIFHPVDPAGEFARLNWLDRERGGSASPFHCSSDDGRRHLCRADTRGGVTLARQLSGTPCIEGQSWGFDAEGVWVDRGCRAEFQVAAGAGPVQGPVVGPGGGPSGGPDQDRPAPMPQMIACLSEDGTRHYCRADVRGGVTLERQLTGTPCIQGESWGYDNQGIWVDRGCRGEFQIMPLTDVGPPVVAPVIQQTITCFSEQGRRRECAADTRGGVSLARQMGNRPCIQGQTWGYGPRGVWVDRGCRAVFELGGGGGQPVPDQPISLTCSSDDGGRHFCAADTSRGVVLVRQESQAPCVQNESWGYDRQGVWVNRNCRATFQIGGDRSQ